MHEAEAWYWDEVRSGRPAPGRRRALRSVLPRAHADAVAFRFGLEGPRETLVMACASGAASIALGADLIRDGVVDVALVGGVDALTRICFMGFNALKLLAPSRAGPSTATAAACRSARPPRSSSSRKPGAVVRAGGAHTPSSPARR
jgi:3-oxoacyl-(acyl-carrier-protein) synthase